MCRVRTVRRARKGRAITGVTFAPKGEEDASSPSVPAPASAGASFFGAAADAAAASGCTALRGEALTPAGLLAGATTAAWSPLAAAAGPPPEAKVASTVPAESSCALLLPVRALSLRSSFFSFFSLCPPLDRLLWRESARDSSHVVVQAKSNQAKPSHTKSSQRQLRARAIGPACHALKG